ncbi:MAG TPA: hypothetical protein VF503_29605 [Sphingobium sp.]|uniref:hypothetical protein n=1 Tax=Sphingobium sp. TaxID=1912891 RepID=UPI002ED3D034
MNSKHFLQLAAIVASCPDRFKSAPSTFGLAKPQDGGYLAEKLDAHREIYGANYERCKRANSSATRDPNSAVELLPGLSRSLFLASDASAQSTGNMINVDTGSAQALSR